MSKRKTEMFLGILSILTVISTAVGVSFAWFSSTMTNGSVSKTVSTASVGGVTFIGGSDFSQVEDLEPGWADTKTIAIDIAPSIYAQTVYIYMDYTNTMPDLAYKLTLTDIKVNNTSVGTTSSYVSADYSGNTGTTITSGGITYYKLGTHTTNTTLTLTTLTVQAGAPRLYITYSFAMALPETGSEQNANQGMDFDATLYASTAKAGYYYSATVSGGSQSGSTGISAQ